MRILLISANTETINMVPLPLGLNCVAVATGNAGHEVKLLDLMGAGDNATRIRNAMAESQPHVIGMSVRNVDDQKMSGTKFLLDPVREAVAYCHASSPAPVILGGAGFSIFPQAVLEYLGADLGICGEGELAFPSLLDALEKGEDVARIPGICIPGHAEPQSCAVRAPLDLLPLPDPSLWQIPPGTVSDLWIPIQTRRGCPMKCSYCSTPMLEGTMIRKHLLDDVIRTLTSHCALGFRQFYFVDNTFNFPPDYAKSLCSAIIESGLDIRWRCILYPAFMDEELVRLMSEAGCVEVSLGFESGCGEILQRLNKKYTPQQVRTAAGLLRSHGIGRMGFLLLGGPGETKESVLESLAFADSLDLDMMKLSMGIRIYPQTELERIAKDEGIIAADDNLLYPQFYLPAELREWLERTAAEWMAVRPWCTT